MSFILCIKQQIWTLVLF